MELRRVAKGIPSEQLHLAAVSAHETEQDADRRGLPRAVWTEKPVHLAGTHREVEAVESAHPAERLDQARNRDGHHDASVYTFHDFVKSVNCSGMKAKRYA